MSCIIGSARRDRQFAGMTGNARREPVRQRTSLLATMLFRSRPARKFMTSGFCSRAARSRRSLVVGLALIGLAVASPVLPAHAADTSAKTFLQQIYQKYVGSSADAAKGVPLAAAKEVRGYFTVGLATLILEDRASAAKRGEPPALDGDPFVGHQDWDIS